MSCSDKLSMEKSFITSGPGILFSSSGMIGRLYIITFPCLFSYF